MSDIYKPKITLLADHPNWAFDHIARSVARRLSHKFDFDIKYVCLGDDLDASKTDLIHVFFWGEDYYKKFGFAKNQIIKEVASLRWKYEEPYGYLSTEKFIAKYLDDCSCVVTPANLIFKMLEGRVEDLFHLPNGVESEFFRPPKKTRTSTRLTIGWVGNPSDLSKGLFDILIPATEKYRLLKTDGRMSRYQLSKFYKECDVLAIASIAESQPLPLLEGMSSGCFPVTTNVGIVPELIINNGNGLIVDRDIESFKNAFDWCNANLEKIRTLGSNNRTLAKTRSWDNCAHRFEEIYNYAYNKRYGFVSNNVSSKFNFPSFDMVSNKSRVEDEMSFSSMINNTRLIINESYLRLTLGDRYTDRNKKRIRNAAVGLVRRGMRVIHRKVLQKITR